MLLQAREREAVETDMPASGVPPGGHRLRLAGCCMAQELLQLRIRSLSDGMEVDGDFRFS